MQFFLRACILTCLCSVGAQAQTSFTVQQQLALDSALRMIGMIRDDCSMPPDLLARDAHRTAFHDQLFSNPFFVYDYVANVTGSLNARGDSPTQNFFDKLTTAVGLTPYKRQFYENGLRGDAVAAKLGIDPTTSTGFIAGTVLLRYLSAVIQASEAMRDSRERLMHHSIVMELSDSLWRMSRESETNSIWQLHQEELRSQERAAQFFDIANPPVYKDIYTHGLSLYQQLLDYVNSSGQGLDLMRDSVRSAVITTGLGRVAIGGKGNDVYEGEYTFILDVGGNDIYRLSDTTKAAAAKHAARVIIDLEGNDTYLAGEFSLACGVAGAGILIDVSGDDTYSSSNFSQGCGLFGVGVLHDLAGSDTYLAGTNTQGAGIFGIGLLIDDDGMDVYRAHAQAQGFGATRGAGVLVDRRGNDQYLASSPYVDVLRYEAHQTTFTQGAALGHRPLASGGVGILFDAMGNDQYVTDIYGQGTGYWFGLGALVDNEGEDRYQAYQYAQGAGVHFATGILRDKAGNDVYVSHGVSQGCGHDIALGMLLDDAGDDNYVVESLSLGGGNANAVSVLLDALGNDAYVATNAASTMGFSDFRRSYGMIGLFIDASGNDTYGESTRNATSSVKSTYGVFLDGDFTGDKATTARAGGELSSPLGPGSSGTHSAGKLATGIDSLFIQASAAPLRFQPNVKPAKDRIVAAGAGALPLLARHMGTQMPRERLALEEILPRIYEKSPAEVEQLVLDSMLSKQPAVFSMAATVAGKIKLKTAIPALTTQARHESWKVRRLVGLTMGEIGDSTALAPLRALLRDEHPYVRARAAYAYGTMCTAGMLADLRPAMKDTDAIVRYSAAEGIGRGIKRNLSDLTPFWPAVQKNTEVIPSVRMLASLDTTASAAAALSTYLPTASAKFRIALQQVVSSMPRHVQDAVAGKPYNTAAVVASTTETGDTDKKKKKEKKEKKEKKKKKSDTTDEPAAP